jgi:hypothetical protein
MMSYHRNTHEGTMQIIGITCSQAIKPALIELMVKAKVFDHIKDAGSNWQTPYYGEIHVVSAMSHEEVEDWLWSKTSYAFTATYQVPAGESHAS